MIEDDTRRMNSPTYGDIWIDVLERRNGVLEVEGARYMDEDRVGREPDIDLDVIREELGQKPAAKAAKTKAPAAT